MGPLLRSLIAVAGLHVTAIVGILGWELRQLIRSNTKYAVPEKDLSKTMRAMVFSEFGGPSVLHEERIAQPKCCSRKQVKVKVLAAALNPVDFKQRRMPAPAFLRPLPTTTGFDFCGIVEDLGESVRSKDFKVGDRVFGMLPLMGSPWGAVQEYVVIDSTIIAKAPKSLTCQEAASLPLVGLTVIHALKPVVDEWTRIGQAPGGKNFLIQAGSGGVGTFAIQYTSHVMGGHVATTASAKNADFVRSLGADHVIDYRSQRFEDIVTDRDVVLDIVTQEYEGRTLASKAVLKQGGVGHYINVLSTDWDQANSGESNPLNLFLPLLKKWAYHVLTRFGQGVHYHCNPVSPDGKGLLEIAQLVDHRLIRPIIDKVYPFEEAAEAHAYLETGHARGKVVIEVSKETAAR